MDARFKFYKMFIKILSLQILSLITVKSPIGLILRLFTMGIPP